MTTRKNVIMPYVKKFYETLKKQFYNPKENPFELLDVFPSENREEIKKLFKIDVFAKKRYMKDMGDVIDYVNKNNIGFFIVIKVE